MGNKGASFNHAVVVGGGRRNDRGDRGDRGGGGGQFKKKRY